MRKVAILTLCGNDNCGNKLQNYASIKYFTNIGCKATTIWVTNPYKDTNIKQYLRFIKRMINDHIVSYKRTKYYLSFNKFLNIEKYLICDNDINKYLNLYDYFIVGSDQVWNPYNFNNDSIFFLSTSEKKKNISLSASFGISDIPNQFKKRYIEGLKNFNKISVREDRGKEIVKSLTNRNDVEVLIDPTLLLNEKNWEKVSREPKKFRTLKNKKYILTYFLGKISDERYTEIKRIANLYDCEIINFLNKKDPFYYGGPAEFLFLEKNAFLICTDSFHSSVFAFLFNRPFIIFDREQKNKENMNSRLETLLSKFELRNRKYNGKEITNENLKHDYRKSYKILEIERKKVETFLTELKK